jgi:phosphatidylinositol alpha-1,6-mannosyltransferase
VLYPGVDTTKFVPAPSDPQLRAQLGWSGRRVVLTVGALQKRKGQDMLIRALPAIRRRCPDVLYALIGEGWERAYLDELVSSLNVAEAVQFRGTPTDTELITCYQQCDLFALPNRRVDWDFEGLGIVLLEAQACGKAVVTGTSGGTSETVQPSVTGELVPSDTPEQLGDTIVALLDDPTRRSALGARGREWILAHFEWSQLSRQALSLFTAGQVRGSTSRL